MTDERKRSKKGLSLEAKPKVAVLVGAPASGKTYLTKSLIYDLLQAGHIKDILIFSGSGDLNDDYDQILSDRKILKNWDIDEFKDFIAKRREQAKEEELVPLLIVLDDLLGTFEKDNQFLAHVMSIHRHLKITFILTSQYIAKNVSTQLRECANYAFLFKSTSDASREHAFKSFSGGLKKADFFEIYDEATSVKHQCLFYNRDVDDDDERFNAYKAGKLPSFKIKIAKKEKDQR